jgi:hypothetical protein
MATKKQQSRVAKAKRHGLGRHAFEYVELDEEGNEIEPAEDAKPARGTVKAGAKGKAKAGGKQPNPYRKKPKEPQPASLKRLGKRGALFLPVILLLTLSQKKISIESRLIQALLFAVVFVAIMWGSDWLIYRMWSKRKAKEAAARSPGRPGSGGPGKG